MARDDGQINGLVCYLTVYLGQRVIVHQLYAFIELSGVTAPDYVAGQPLPLVEADACGYVLSRPIVIDADVDRADFATRGAVLRVEYNRYNRG